jgi:hypothetical protein
MEPISSLIVGHVAGKGLELVTKKFRTNVVERWSRHRAEQFFKVFCQQVAAERSLLSDAEVELLLARMLDDDLSTEVLFDAYRRVTLSRSRILGPRIIGLLTATLVSERRVASDEEDTIFAAAEELHDGELREFVAFFKKERAQDTHHKVVESESGLEVQVGDESFDSNWRSKSPKSTGPMDLAESYGVWARKLATLGILVQETREREYDYDEDSERHVDQPGTIREISWWLCVPRCYYKLVELIERADWPDDSTESTEAK